MLNYFVGSVRSPVLERYFRHKVHDNKTIWSTKLLLVSSFLIFCSSLRKVKLKIFRRLTLKKFLLLSCWFYSRKDPDPSWLNVALESGQGQKNVWPATLPKMGYKYFLFLKYYTVCPNFSTYTLLYCTRTVSG